ncbi:MAG: nuclease-related domain-containing protein [Actinomycetota bacterium]|nr:nuclease-related domain-containing protein [Actinomycetota bacterium]
MDFDAANAIGQQGEEAISRELQVLQQEYGLQFLHDVLILDCKQTAQIDHIVVDTYGVLVIEAKVRTGALILGTDVEKKWTACYPGKKHKSFQNPLAQNRQHEAVLRKALKECGEPVDADHVKSVVVFSGANTSELDLSTLERQRVIDVSELRRFFQQRHDFAITTALPEVEQVRMLAAIRGMDRSGDPDALRRHVSGQPYHRTQPSRSEAPRAPAPIMPSSWQQAATPIPVRTESRFGRRLKAVLWDLTVRVAAIGVLALVWWWFFMGPGSPWLSDFLTSGFKSTSAQVAEPAPAATPTRPPLDQAKSALADRFPDIYPKVANIDSPVVGTKNGYWTYTWEYVVKSAYNAATVRQITLLLNDSGEVTGFEKE